MYNVISVPLYSLWQTVRRQKDGLQVCKWRCVWLQQWKNVFFDCWRSISDGRWTARVTCTTQHQQQTLCRSVIAN